MTTYTKAIIMFVFCNFVIYSDGMAQWQIAGDSLLGIGYTVESIKVANDNSVWCVARPDRSTNSTTAQTPLVYRSADEGKTWTITSLGAEATGYAWDISPVDSMTAYTALDTAGLYKTIDGGLTWGKVRTYEHPCIFVHFFNDQDGWVYNGMLWRNGARDSLLASMVSITSDGGLSWTTLGGEDWVIPPGTSLPEKESAEWPGVILSVEAAYDCTDESIVIGMTNGTYWLSNDRGYHWTRNRTPLADSGLIVSNIAIKDSNTIMVASNVYTKSNFANVSKLIGRGPLSYATSDGGNKWIQGTPEVSAGSLAYLPGSDSIWVMVSKLSQWWGGMGTAITYDLGVHWQTIDNNRIGAIDFLDSKTAFGSCCHSKFWKTTTGRIFKWNYPLPEVPEQIRASRFWLIIPIVSVLFLVIFWNRRSNYLSKNTIASHILELNQSAKKAHIDPDFIFNCLNSIQDLINKNDKESANTYLTGFAKLTRGVLRASSESIISLEDDIELLKNYLSLEKLRFSDRLNYHIVIDEDLDVFDTMVPAMVAHSIVENAIRNGLKSKPSTGTIHVEYQLLEKQFRIVVEDDFADHYSESNDHSREGQRMEVAGIGHIKDRLALMHSHCEMRVERVQTADGKASGTKTTVDIMLN